MSRFGLKEEVTSFITSKATELGMKRVVLFGSRAKGTYSDKSDIDLALEGDSSQAFQAALEDECPTLLSFDFIDLSQEISSGLRQRIEDEGVVLYEIR